MQIICYNRINPTIFLSIILFLLYQFLAMPLTIGVSFILVFLGTNANEIKTFLSEIIMTFQIVISGALTIFLTKNYFNFLMSERFKKDYILYLKVGLWWSSPIILLHLLSFLIPTFRENFIKKHLFEIISFEGATYLKLFLFSIWVVLGAIFEEFLFRGILIQKLLKYTNNKISIIISAGLFALSHFSFSHINMSALTSSFLLGVLCGVAYTSTCSCLSAILPHLLNNLIWVVLAWGSLGLK